MFMNRELWETKFTSSKNRAKPWEAEVSIEKLWNEREFRISEMAMNRPSPESILLWLGPFEISVSASVTGAGQKSEDDRSEKGKNGRIDFKSSLFSIKVRFFRRYIISHIYI